MELEGQTIVLYLTPPGFQQLSFLLNLKDQYEGVGGLVRSTDAFGVALSVVGERWRRALMVPWHFICAMELEIEGGLAERSGKPSDSSHEAGGEGSERYYWQYSFSHCEMK